MRRASLCIDRIGDDRIIRLFPFPVGFERTADYDHRVLFRIRHAVVGQQKLDALRTFQVQMRVAGTPVHVLIKVSPLILPIKAPVHRVPARNAVGLIGLQRAQNLVGGKGLIRMRREKPISMFRCLVRYPFIRRALPNSGFGPEL
jgi:hypothetical protein